MKKTIIATMGILFAGCESTNYDFQDAPDHLLHTQDRLAATDKVIPPKREIDYRGHGLGYGSHAQHYRHLHHVHGPACLCHLPRNNR